MNECTHCLNNDNTVRQKKSFDGCMTKKFDGFSIGRVEPNQIHRFLIADGIICFIDFETWYFLKKSEER